MRVVIADDAVLVREGIARLLDEAGLGVVGQAGDADGLLQPCTTATRCRDRRYPHASLAHRRGPARRARDPVALSADGGARALAVPRAGVRDAAIEQAPGGVGYLLKERVGRSSSWSTPSSGSPPASA